MHGTLFRASTLETLSKDNKMKASNNAFTTKPHSHVSGMFLSGRVVVEIEAHVCFFPHRACAVTKYEVFASHTNHKLHYLINPASFFHKKRIEKVLRTLMLRAKTILSPS